MTDQIPVGMLYHSDDLAGDAMETLEDALHDAGFSLEKDPLEDQAELFMEVEHADG